MAIIVLCTVRKGFLYDSNNIVLPVQVGLCW